MSWISTANCHFVIGDLLIRRFGRGWALRAFLGKEILSLRVSLAQRSGQLVFNWVQLF